MDVSYSWEKNECIESMYQKFKLFVVQIPFVLENWFWVLLFFFKHFMKALNFMKWHNHILFFFSAGYFCFCFFVSVLPENLFHCDKIDWGLGTTGHGFSFPSHTGPFQVQHVDSKLTFPVPWIYWMKWLHFLWLVTVYQAANIIEVIL